MTKLLKPSPKADEDEESLASSSSSSNSSTNSNFLDSTSGTGRGEGVSNTSNSGSGGEKQLKEKIIAHEQKAVRMARIGVLVAVVVAAVVVASLVYVFARRSDINTFEVEYERVTSTLVDQVQLQVQYNFALMEMLSAEMTSAALLSNPQFPNFTHPHFEVHGGYTDGMGGIMMSAYAPFILSSKQHEWEEYSVENQAWLNESAWLKQIHPGHRDPLKGTFQSYEGDRRVLQDDVQMPNEPNIHPHVFHMMEDGTKQDETPTDDYKILAPLWQSSPHNPDVVNANLMRHPRLEQMIGIVMQVKHTVMSPASEIGQLFDWMFDDHEKYRKAEPHTFLLDLVWPTYQRDEPGAEPVGFVLGLTSYRNFFDKSLPEGTDGVVCVLEEPCAEPFSYVINGKTGSFLGFGDHHDRNYDKYLIEVPLEMFVDVDDPILCPHILKIYPSKVFEDKYKTNQAWIFTGVVLAAFAMTALMLVVYDILVTRRQKKTMEAAVRTNRIVTQLFPKNVRERLLADHDNATKAAHDKLGKANRILNQNDGAEFDQDGKFNTPPIADFFPDTTVLFADLVGFTAWSSVREPAQVFTLLETIYMSFDRIAKRRKIFKVETVGDCYVAVCGLPNPRRDHAVAMARFARDCMACTDEWVKKLELSLGPDTAELSMRMGMHSGPCTGGVLRGERSRFQLFGDTMNTTARIESTGAPKRIHISKETADLLIAAGKQSWLTQRDDKVVAKGKGEMTTFWLSLHHARQSDNRSMSSGGSQVETEILAVPEANDLVKPEAPTQEVDAKMARLVDWNVDVLLRLLKQVVAHRTNGSTKSCSTLKTLKSKKDGKTTVLDEVAEVIELPKSKKVSSTQNDSKSIELPPAVGEQLQHYIQNICGMYRNNPFHNFEHASHVTMSVTKLLSRIVSTTDVAMTHSETKEDKVEALLHDHTYGITSDPLTQFSCVLSALIHDADHPGVSNAQLVKEGAPIAEYYKGKSIAEQNSVDIAWDLLMEDRYSDLRACIYNNDEAEMLHFRQLIVNAVMATDIVDKDLKQLRNARWEKAFSKDLDEDVSHSMNRKATIVIEHLLQASDVAHTMQHWHIYRKWNERLFLECYKAYKDGRGGEKNPSEFWYKGEIGFFDFYIIPLARKLKDCGVFGVSSDEYLNYAEKNRAEWEQRGLEVVEELKAKALAEFG